jgi:hypothetical protein
MPVMQKGQMPAPKVKYFKSMMLALTLVLIDIELVK